jgi:hypothetical protein
MDWFKSRYVRLLESENERMRVEIRALLNSLLKSAGRDPIEANPLEVKPPQEPTRRVTWRSVAKMMRAKSAKALHELDLNSKTVADGENGVRPQ